MDPRGYDRGYGYSTRPVPAPPVYSIEQSRRPDYRATYTHKKREYSESESSESSYHRAKKYNIEDPPDGGQWAWLIVLACAVLHICNELVYFMFYNTVVFSTINPLATVAHLEIPYTDFKVFEMIRIGGEFVAAIASVVVGYRVVAAFGSVCVGAGFLAASFVDPSDNKELMGFLVGFLGGIGCSFWRFTAYVAIMEYFQRYRMPALILSGFGRVLGIFAGYGILAAPLKVVLENPSNADDIKDLTEWDIYYKCQMVMAGVAFFASLVIKPVSFGRGRRYMDCATVFKLRNTSICRGGMLVLVLAMYFLYYLGESYPNVHLVYWMNSMYHMTHPFTTTQTFVALFTIACGVTLGYIFLIFWPKKKKLYSTLMWMGAFSLMLGFVTILTPVFNSMELSYLASISVVIGICQVMFETLLRYVIPIGFGRLHIRWIEGLLGFSGGCALVAGKFIVEELVKEDGGLKNIYYWAGSGLLAAGVLGVVTINIVSCLKYKDRNLERDWPEIKEQIAIAKEDEMRDRERARIGRSSRREEYYNYGYR